MSKWLGISFLILLLACSEEDSTDVMRFPELMEVPSHFPSIDHPDDNAFTLERWKLGRALFIEKAMSVDSSISCASCHQQGLGFADALATTPGVFDRPGTRNVPTLANVAYQPYYLKEGGVQTLEMQVLVPFQEHNEFNLNILDAVDRLAKDKVYQSMARQAYDRDMDVFVLTRALGVYERSLVSGWSSYDAYVNSGDPEDLNPEALRGMDLFFSERTNCSGCHGGFNFTNYEIVNNGLYPSYEDKGLFRITRSEGDIGKFKVPTLRNIEITGPYMHDGSLLSLEAVVDHYNRGGVGHPNQDPRIQALDLSAEEKSDLIAFLKSLTDPSFINNPNL